MGRKNYLPFILGGLAILLIAFTWGVLFSGKNKGPGPVAQAPAPTNTANTTDNATSAPAPDAKADKSAEEPKTDVKSADAADSIAQPKSEGSEPAASPAKKTAGSDPAVDMSLAKWKDHYAVSLADDGKTLKPVVDGKPVNPIWHQEAKSEVEADRVHHSKVESALFSFNGSRLATCDADGRILLWNFSKGAIDRDPAWINAWLVVPPMDKAKRSLTSYSEGTEEKDGRKIAYNLLTFAEDGKTRTFRLEERFTRGKGYGLYPEEITEKEAGDKKADAGKEEKKPTPKS